MDHELVLLLLQLPLAAQLGYLTGQGLYLLLHLAEGLVFDKLGDGVNDGAVLVDAGFQ